MPYFSVSCHMRGSFLGASVGFLVSILSQVSSPEYASSSSSNFTFGRHLLHLACSNCCFPIAETSLSRWLFFKVCINIPSKYKASLVRPACHSCLRGWLLGKFPITFWEWPESSLARLFLFSLSWTVCQCWNSLHNLWENLNQTLGKYEDHQTPVGWNS